MTDINWNEVSEALTTAEALKNHYKFAERLVGLVGVVNRAKYLMDEAEKARVLAETAATAARSNLAKLGQEMKDAREKADRELAGIKERVAAAQATAGRDLAETQAKLDELAAKAREADAKQAARLAEQNSAFEAAKRALEAKHAARVAQLQAEIDSLQAARDAAGKSAEDLRGKLQGLAAQLR